MKKIATLIKYIIFFLKSVFKNNSEPRNWWPARTDLSGWEIIQKYSLYLLIFLTPIFFLPLTYSPIAVNKEFIVSILALISFFAFLGNSVLKGKIERPKSVINFFVLFLGLVWFLSALFSQSKLVSFGLLGGSPESFFNFATYILIFFLASVTFSKKEEIIKALAVFVASSFILAIFTFSQLLGFFPLNKISSLFTFTASSDFNPVGSPNAFSLYLSVVLLLALSLITFSKFGNLLKYLFILGGVTRIIDLIFINYWPSWLILALGSILIFSFKFYFDSQKLSFLPRPSEAGENGNLDDGGLKIKFFSSSLLVFIVSVVFLATGLRHSFEPRISAEISPTFVSTFNIAKKVLKHDPVLGSGLATFSASWAKYNSLNFNSNPNLSFLAGFKFVSGFSAFATFLSTSGILGFISFSVLFLYFLFAAFSKTILKNQTDSISISLALSTFVLFVCWFLYPLNYVIAVFTFLFLGLFLSDLAVENRIKISQKSLFGTPQKAMLIPIFFIFLMTLVGWLVYWQGKRYVAAVYFGKYLKNQDISYLGKAVNFDQWQDIYLKSLAQANISKLSEALNEKPEEGKTDDVKNKIQQFANSAVAAAVLAKDRNSIDYQNWSFLGQVYEAISTFSADANNQAVDAYKRARDLDPQNALYYYNIGKIQFGLNNLNEAKEELLKAIDFSPNYSNARYFLGLIYQKEGDKAKAEEEFNQVLILNPGNQDIVKLIESLKTEKPAEKKSQKK